jgi:hypothetical protein
MLVTWPSRAEFRNKEEKRKGHSLSALTALLYSDPLNFIEGKFIGRAVIEFCGPGALMRGDRLRVLERSAAEQIGSNAGSHERYGSWGRRRVPPAGSAA